MGRSSFFTYTFAICSVRFEGYSRNSTQVSADKLHLDLWKRGSDQHIVNFKRKSPHEDKERGKVSFCKAGEMCEYSHADCFILLQIAVRHKIMLIHISYCVSEVLNFD